MVGIEAIASYVPAQARSNLERCAELGVTPDFIEQKIGALTLPVRAETEDTSDLVCHAVENLLASTALKADAIDGLIVVTQNPDGFGLPHCSAIAHGKLGLATDCAAFDLSLGCSGYVYGLAVAKSLAEAHGLANVILATADPYSKVVDPDDRNTSLLFGDAATATLLVARVDDRPRLTLVRALFGTDGTRGEALRVDPERRLRMDGRGVFNFSATTVPDQIKRLLDVAGLTADDIDLFLFHQGSKYIVDTLARRLELPPEKVPVGLKRTGNTVSSSIPLLLRDRLSPDDHRRILIAGFGVGLSYASAILEWKA